MNDSPLLNPNGQLFADVAARLVKARKTKSIWAKRAVTRQSVETIEGTLTAEPDDYLCRGIVGEHWPQKYAKILDKYVPSAQMDSEGWQRFDPKPDAAPVNAAQIDKPFRVAATWGELTGQANDYLVQSTTDPTDIWIVSQSIFEASYELVARAK